MPDAVVICINYHDELDYIRNTVYTIKGLTDASLIAFVMYPMTYLNGVMRNVELHMRNLMKEQKN